MSQSLSDKKLLYVGDGSWLPGVPARDLSADEIDILPFSRGDLLKSGLYIVEPESEVTNARDRQTK